MKREEWGGRVGWLLGILGDELGPPADVVFRKRMLRGCWILVEREDTETGKSAWRFVKEFRNGTRFNGSGIETGRQFRVNVNSCADVMTGLQMAIKISFAHSKAPMILSV